MLRVHIVCYELQNCKLCVVCSGKVPALRLDSEEGVELCRNSEYLQILPKIFKPLTFFPLLPEEGNKAK